MSWGAGGGGEGCLSVSVVPLFFIRVCRVSRERLLQSPVPVALHILKFFFLFFSLSDPEDTSTLDSFTTYYLPYLSIRNGGMQQRVVIQRRN